jgi:hypothetical protein
MTRVGRRDTRQRLFPPVTRTTVSWGSLGESDSRQPSGTTIHQYFQSHTTVRRRWLAKTLTTAGESSKRPVRVSRRGSCAAIAVVHGSGRATKSCLCRGARRTRREPQIFRRSRHPFRTPVLDRPTSPEVIHLLVAGEIPHRGSDRLANGGGLRLTALAFDARHPPRPVIF